MIKDAHSIGADIGNVNSDFSASAQVRTFTAPAISTVISRLDISAS